MGLKKKDVDSKEIVESSLTKSGIRLGVLPAVYRPFE